jgi:hypothetical protein
MNIPFYSFVSAVFVFRYLAVACPLPKQAEAFCSAEAFGRYHFVEVFPFSGLIFSES